LGHGIETIHLLGRSEERIFVNSVVEDLLTIRGLKGKEYFPLYRDYRGVRDGIGVSLTRNRVLGNIVLPDRIRTLDQKFGTAATDQADVISNSVPSEPVVLDGSEAKLAQVVEELVVRLSDFEGDWIALAELGSVLRQEHPEFTPSMYGARNLYSILRRLTILEFVERGLGSGKAVYVRIGAGVQKGAAVGSADRSDLERAIINILTECENEGGWLFLGVLGGRIKATIERFKPAEYGFGSLHDLISSLPFAEIDERGDGRSKSYVRLKRAF